MLGIFTLHEENEEPSFPSIREHPAHEKASKDMEGSVSPFIYLFIRKNMFMQVRTGYI